MNFLTTIKSSTIVKKIRQIKAALFSPDDARQAQEVAPSGYDAAPVAGVVALYIQTSKATQPVFAGYINANQLAKPGDVRIFATDADGNEVSRIWQSGGKIEIGGTGDFGSNSNHLTQFESLNTELQNEVNQINAQLALIQTAITGLGGTYAKVDVTLDISTAKTTKLIVE
jgi:hypothetical protein